MDEHAVKYTMRVEDDALIYARESVRERRELVYRGDRCVGCWLCYESCPTEAISKNPIGAPIDEEAEHQNILIDPQKCVHCGVCAEVCMFDALDVRVNGASIVDLAYPRFQERWELSEEKCVPKDAANRVLCKDCEVACPRGALKCGLVVKDEAGTVVVKNTVERDRRLCIHCTTCMRICPQDALVVEKVFDGEISVDLELCQGCGVCVDVCPSKALSMPKAGAGERADRLVVNQDACVFCGACANSCPVEALTAKRKGVRYNKEKARSATKRRERIFLELTTAK